MFSKNKFHTNLTKNCHVQTSTTGIGTYFTSTSRVLSPGIGTDPGYWYQYRCIPIRNAVHADSIWLLFLSTNTWNTIAAKKDIPAWERHPCFCAQMLCCEMAKPRRRYNNRKRNKKKQNERSLFSPPDSTENSRFILLAWCCCLLSIWSEVSPCEKIAKNLERKKRLAILLFSVSAMLRLKRCCLWKNEKRAQTEEAAERTGRARKRTRQVQHLWNVTRDPLSDFFFFSWSFCFVFVFVFFPWNSWITANVLIEDRSVKKKQKTSQTCGVIVDVNLGQQRRCSFPLKVSHSCRTFWKVARGS